MGDPEMEFTVKLDLVRLKLGLDLIIDTDFKPLSVMRIKKNGLVQQWNSAHPGREGHPGDQIIRVNNIMWHNNSRLFAQRIKGEVYDHKAQRKADIIRKKIDNRRAMRLSAESDEDEQWHGPDPRVALAFRVRRLRDQKKHFSKKKDVQGAVEEQWWTYTPVNELDGLARVSPNIAGKKTGELIRPGESFRVSETQLGADGVLYLKL